MKLLILHSDTSISTESVISLTCIMKCDILCRLAKLVDSAINSTSCESCVARNNSVTETLIFAKHSVTLYYQEIPIDVETGIPWTLVRYEE